MPLTASNRASKVALGTVETTFSSASSVIASAPVLLGGYSALKTSVVENQFYTISNAKQAAETFGYGEQLHRMAQYYFKSNSNAVNMIALTPDVSGVASTYTLTFTSNATQAGTYVLRAGSYLVEEALSITVAVGDTPEEIATKVVAAVNALQSLPLTAAATLGEVTFTSKALDSTGADLSITLNQKSTDSSQPEGTSYVIASGITGAGTADVGTALNLLASTSSGWNTSIVQPYNTVASQDLVLNIVGNPTDLSGLYDSIDYRPFYSIVVDTAEGLTGLNAQIAITEARPNDCANINAAAPSSPELGYEIACSMCGDIELASETNPVKAYTTNNMSHLYGPLDNTKDWTTYSDDASVKPYSNRDLAVRGGVTPLIYKDNTMNFGDVVTPWLPEDNQNAPFKYVVNIRKIWNCQYSYFVYLSSDAVTGKAIVNNINATNQGANAIDEDTVKAGLAVVTGNLEKDAFLYGADFTLRNTSVTVSDINSDRFVVTLPIIISGNYRQADGTILVDRDVTSYDLTVEV